MTARPFFILSKGIQEGESPPWSCKFLDCCIPNFVMFKNENHGGTSCWFQLIWRKLSQIGSRDRGEKMKSIWNHRLGYLVGAQPSPCCSFARHYRHLVGKIDICIAHLIITRHSPVIYCRGLSTHSPCFPESWNWEIHDFDTSRLAELNCEKLTLVQIHPRANYEINKSKKITTHTDMAQPNRQCPSLPTNYDFGIPAKKTVINGVITLINGLIIG